MSNVRRMPCNTDDPEVFIRDILREVQQNEYTSVVVALKCADTPGVWMTGRMGANFGVQAEAIAHLQADLIDAMIIGNAERYGLHTHE